VGERVRTELNARGLPTSEFSAAPETTANALPDPNKRP
jgi:hypothetical protein